jgi:hypothetical protein
MEQGHIITFRYRTDLNLGVIGAECGDTYDQDAYATLSTKYCVCPIQLNRTDLTTLCVGGEPPLEDIDAKIFSGR